VGGAEAVGAQAASAILTWLPAYDRSAVRFDLIAGATVWGLWCRSRSRMRGWPVFRRRPVCTRCSRRWPRTRCSGRAGISSSGRPRRAAQTFATKSVYEIDPNQELIAPGAANAGSGVLGGLAAGGSLSQSAVNEGAGARSEASPLVAAALILVTVLFLTPLFKNLLEAVLAALIIHAVSHLWKVRQFRIYYREQRIEFWLGLATLAGVTLIDVLPGLVIGVLAMLLLVIYTASRPRIGVLGRVPGVPGAYGDLERHPDYLHVPDLLVLRLEGALFYANAALVRDRIKQLVGASDPCRRR
jgi:sulfate permease, SulP family